MSATLSIARRHRGDKTWSVSISLANMAARTAREERLAKLAPPEPEAESSSDLALRWHAYAPNTAAGRCVLGTYTDDAILVYAAFSVPIVTALQGGVRPHRRRPEPGGAAFGPAVGLDHEQRAVGV